MPTEASCRRGRHRRTRGDWWRELLWPNTTAAVTVQQALRQWNCERTSLPAAIPDPDPRSSVPAIAGWPSVQHAAPDASAPDGQPATHHPQSDEVRMPARPPRPAYHHWRDIDGTPIPDRCRIEQIAVHKEHGALPSRLHRQGQVLGRGSTRLQVRFDGEILLVRLRPHLVRVLVLGTAPGGR